MSVNRAIGWELEGMPRIVRGAGSYLYDATGKRYLVLHGDKFDGVIYYAPWLAKLGDTFANTGGNGTNGPLAVQNIFDFINEWLAGCAPNGSADDLECSQAAASQSALAAAPARGRLPAPAMFCGMMVGCPGICLPM
mgnify:CR=1 FL=1